ncbi:MAG: JDVT-CTERM system CAAX-type protease [Piscinibacter sp.]|nr:JDVT-CTERM system CAAX-type protease [Piscinibacter sp.]
MSLALAHSPGAGAAGPRRGRWVAAAVLFVAAVAAVALHAEVAPLRVLVLLAVAPLAEEAVLRAGLHEALLRRRMRAVAANIACAIAFGLVHALVRGDLAALAVALPALLVGAVYGRTRRLRNAVLLHAVLNAAWLAAVLADVLPRFLR